MYRYRTALPTLWLAVCLTASPSYAQNPDLPARASSEAVREVIGSVVRVVPRHVTQPTGDELIVSKVTVAVEAVLKGPPAKIVETEVVGGTVNGITMASSWVPVLSVGDTALFRLDHRHRPIKVHGDAIVLLENPDAFLANGPTWGPSVVPFYVNPVNADVPHTSAILAIQTGLAGWGEQSQAAFAWVYAGTTTGSAFQNNGKNEVFFRNIDAGSIIAEVRWWYSGARATGTLLDADILFYDGGQRFFTGTSGCSGGYYIEDVVTHEGGHALGLGHTTVSGATMFPSIASCSQGFRSLAADDIAAVEFLYPPDGVPPPPPPDGTITLIVTTKASSSWRYVFFTWTGVIGSPVEIYQDGVKVKSTSNDGHTILAYPLGSHATHVFKVCTAGGTACSPNVSVTW